MAENLTMQEYIDEAESELLHTYNRYQIVLDKGDGVYLYDYNGKKYLDFSKSKYFLSHYLISFSL